MTRRCASSCAGPRRLCTTVPPAVGAARDCGAPDTRVRRRIAVPADSPVLESRPALDRGQLPTPWQGSMQRADRIIVGGIALSGIYGLVLLPLFPVLASSHPALLELVRGSPASIVNMGARARIGETSFLLAVVLAVPSVMMFDWLFWWAGRRWGDRVFSWLLGGDSPRNRRRLARMRRLERRFGPLAVVLANILPVPSAVVYAAVGDGGMRLGVFLVLDVLGTLVWTGLLATLGYLIGRGAVDVTYAISHYSLWITLALVAAIVAFRGRRGLR